VPVVAIIKKCQLFGYMGHLLIGLPTRDKATFIAEEMNKLEYGWGLVVHGLFYRC